MELLIVVLIIGILSAVALPQYQKSVMKSRYTGLMPITKALTDANEAYYLEHGEYAEDPTQLTVSSEAQNADAIITLSDDEDYAFVQATAQHLPGMRHVSYQKHSKNFAGNVHCEASTEQGKGVCIAAGGQLLGNREGYAVYRISGSGTGEMPYEQVTISDELRHLLGNYSSSYYESYTNGENTVVANKRGGYYWIVYTCNSQNHCTSGSTYCGDHPACTSMNGAKDMDELCDAYPFFNKCQ